MNIKPRRGHRWTPARPIDIEDIEQAMPWIAEYRRAAIRLHPRRTERPLPPNASKMGGIFLWPAEEPWPFCREADPVSDVRLRTREEFLENVAMLDLAAPDPEVFGLPPRAPGDPDDTTRIFQKLTATVQALGEPHNVAYSPIIQLRRDDFPELPWPEQRDLFQLLWCPQVHFWGNSALSQRGQSSGARIFWRTEASVLNPIAHCESVNGKDSLYECALNPEEIVEYPQACEFDATLEEWLQPLYAEANSNHGADSARWWYSYDIAAAPGTKLFGHPQWVQDKETPACQCGNPMQLMLTCSSQEDSDSRAWNVEPRHGLSADDPFGFRWGDWSNAYVFYCHSGHPLEFRSLVQSS